MHVGPIWKGEKVGGGLNWSFPLLLKHFMENFVALKEAMKMSTYLWH